MFFRKKKALEPAYPEPPATTTPFRRIVTGHDRGGWSVPFGIDMVVPVTTEAGDAAYAQVWATPEVPANLNDGSDGAGVTGRGGSMIRVVDFMPGRKSRMHRSWSIDYAIVLEGEIDLQLDGGAVERLGAGDIVVQRGTSHRWRNPGQDICRVVFVLIEALPVAVQGEVLPESDG